MSKNFAKDIFDSEGKELKEQEGVCLLKELEAIGIETFKESDFFSSERQVLGEDAELVDKVIKAVIESEFGDIREYSKDFFKVYDVSVKYQRFLRKLISLALDELDCGYSLFDKNFIQGAFDVMNKYDDYYREWMRAIHNSDAAKKISQMQKDRPDELKDIISKNGLDNHYTIIDLDDKGNLHAVPYIEYFDNTLNKVVSALNSWIGNLRAITGLSSEQEQYIEYLSQYVQALSEDSIDLLEEAWSALDRLWVKVKYPIQIVHDIEYGYGDPLRVKVTPDFSLRFLDNSYSEENETIDDVRKILIDFYSQKDTELSEIGLNALDNSFAGIYYLPVRTGMSLHFRFAGQSIPNRPKIRASEGIKIYFDPVSWGMRMQQVKQLIRKVFRDESLVDRIDPVESIVNHVSAHEFGHAIYGLESLVGEGIDSQTKSLLEEPRAELTTLTTLLLMYEREILNTRQLADSLFSFAASDLRRFANFDSQATRPYTISAINTYNVYEKTGYISKKGNKLVINEDKVPEVFDILADQFDQFLNAEDQEDGQFLRNLLTKMQKEGELVKWLVGQLG